MTQYEIMLGLALTGHAGQFRRDGVTPYVTHPIAVAMKVKGDKAKAIAIGHDLFEDTALTPADLSNAGIDDDIIDAIELLTKTDGDYMRYIERIRENEFARAVKIADMLHNLSENPTVNQIRKYATALLFLTEGME